MKIALLALVLLGGLAAAGPGPGKGPAAPLRIENGLGFRTLEDAKSFREYWAKLADEDRLTGKVSDHLSRDRIASSVALEVHIAVAQFFDPAHTSLDDELQRFLDGGHRFHTGRLPDGFENARAPKAVVLLIRTRDGEYGLITYYQGFIVVELNKRVGVVLEKAAGKAREKKEEGRGAGGPRGQPAAGPEKVAPAGRPDVTGAFNEEGGGRFVSRATRGDGKKVLHGLQVLVRPGNGGKEHALFADGALVERVQYYPGGLVFRRQQREPTGDGYEIVYAPERTKVLKERVIVDGGADIGPIKVQEEFATGWVKADRRWKGTFLEWEPIPGTFGQERFVLREYRDGAVVMTTPIPAEKLALRPDPQGRKGSAAWPWRWSWPDDASLWPAVR